MTSQEAYIEQLQNLAKDAFPLVLYMKTSIENVANIGGMTLSNHPRYQQAVDWLDRFEEEL